MPPGPCRGVDSQAGRPAARLPAPAPPAAAPGAPPASFWLGDAGERPPHRQPYDSSFTSNVPSSRLSRIVTKPLGFRKSITPSMVPCHPQT